MANTQPQYEIVLTDSFGGKYLTGARYTDRQQARNYARFVLLNGWDNGHRMTVTGVQVREYQRAA
jgi:hypothetical protein